MTTTAILPMGPYPAGTYTIPATSVPLNIGTVKLSADRTLWIDAASIVVASMEWSLDGGTTWSPGGSWTSHGGTALLPDGITVSIETNIVVTMPQSTNPNRKVRGSVVVSGATAISAVSLTTS